jgi:hypothetical protein
MWVFVDDVGKRLSGGRSIERYVAAATALTDVCNALVYIMCSAYLFRLMPSIIVL